MKKWLNHKVFLEVVLVVMLVGMSLNLSHGEKSSSESNHQMKGISPERVADFVHDIVEADRTVYSTFIVERLQKKNILHASEHWENQDALPLPAQLLQKAGKLVAEKGRGIRYRLVSMWPIYERNGPVTEFEREGLQAVSDNPNKPFTGVITSGKLRYYQAIYADKAITKACVECHNTHRLSPKRDFQLNDVMGAIVITIPLDE
ncbi:DUF3365 domain-containing protein [Candidatus Nitronereus thalassa]|uniref:DUF3365 domain-containing protein n=1 Tax=Candidatus Nitronereus thalassa TaxID=3020898 RepID=A0ABU3K9G9_9BACT|nr:DUF3365 domain-containing protein [Candidatus Nitronereus thalassa]MDT7043038.1 DUF3365 domain-containing protein [Candidatus Nitronereus thalassa]